MRSLRRDLLERRLWPIVALLLVAVVAVPLMLRGNTHADAIAVPPAPPVASLASAPQTTAQPSHKARGTQPATSPTGPAHTLDVSIPRNPFSGGMPTLKSKPASQTASTSSTAAPTTTTGSMVTPTPSTPPSTGSSAPSPGTGTTPTTTTTPTSTTTSTTSTTTTSTTPTTTSTTPVPTSWTLYSVDVRYGMGSFDTERSNIARLTPLPSASNPEVMFMGLMNSGQQAVFLLGAGVVASGPGLCRPERAHCAAVVLEPGQTELLTVTTEGDAHQDHLRVTSVSKQVTDSQSDATAAYQRVSAAGRCELDLANPVSYSQSEGALSNVATAACRGLHRVVPFPGALVAP